MSVAGEQQAGTPPAAEPLVADRPHIPALDGLRGLAILLVICYHFFLAYPGWHTATNLFGQAAQTGWMGVDLFFVLSGFLITRILIETKQQAGYFRNFLARRFLRIWPLYYLSLAALLIVLPLVVSPVPNGLQRMQERQIWFWLYGANWLFAREGGFEQTSGGYFWSLAVEEQFYLFWPLLVRVLSERALLRLSIALLVASLGLRIVLASLGTSTGALYAMTFTHLDGLSVGAIIALTARSPRAVATLKRWIPVAVVGSLLVLGGIRIADGNFFFWSPHVAIFGYTFIAVLSGALLVHTLYGSAAGYNRRFFTSRFMRASGKYSYALYLIHVPIANLVFPKVGNVLPAASHAAIVFLAGCVVSFGLCWLVASLSWIVLEKPLLSLKKYFAYA
jgi:peptidoglycan/LPS O-acetylase OafA/YrhL